MNERADSVNGLIEHQTMVRFSPKLADRVHNDFLGAPTDQLPHFQIEWTDERHAKVEFGDEIFPGILLDLPTINELYKMGSKSRLFKSGDMGQMLLVHDDKDSADCEFFESQRFDPVTFTLLSGVTPPSTYIYSRIFRQQNKPPKTDFAKVEQDLGDVNVLRKEDVQMDFIHPRELETLMVKPGQTLLVDGIEVEPIEGKSVGEIIKIRRQEKAEELAREIREERRAKKRSQKRRKMGSDLLSPGYSASGDLSSDKERNMSSDPQIAKQTSAPWQVAVDKAGQKTELEARIASLESRLQQMQHRPDFTKEDQDAVNAEIEQCRLELQQALIH